MLIVILTKIILPVCAMIITILGLKSRWTIQTDRLFERYSKLSKLSFELSEQFDNKRLRQISEEYGYAAITREKKLSKDERRTLLDMVNPVQGIEEYHICADYLKIDVVGNGFSWKKRRYNTIYRTVLGSLLSIQYFIGAIMFFCPIFYAALQDTFIGSFFRRLNSDLQVGLAIYVICTGAFLAFPSLNKLSRLYRSAKLIETTEQKQLR